MVINAFDPRVLAAVLLLFSAGALYLACRGAIRAVIAPTVSSPGRRSLCQCLPIATTAIAAVLMHHPAVAMAVVFGTSVAYMSLVLGMVSYVAPMPARAARPRFWAFVLAPVLLALLAGFAGSLHWLDTIIFLVLGGTIYAVWREDATRGTLSTPSSVNESSVLTMNGARWTQAVLAIVLAGLAGMGAVRAAALVAQQSPMPSDTLVALSVLSPVLILPALRTCVTVAEGGDTQGAVSAIVGTVLLNLCLLLPLLIVLQSVSTRFSSPPSGLHYPDGIWRMETVVLVVLGFAMIPVALGRVTIARIEAGVLILGYALYLAGVAWSAKLG